MTGIGACRTCGVQTVRRTGARGIVPMYCPTCLVERKRERDALCRVPRTPEAERLYRVEHPRSLTCRDCGASFFSPNGRMLCLPCATPKPKVKPVRLRSCLTCGVTFTQARTEGYCTDACRLEMGRRRYRADYHSVPLRPFECSECGVIFEGKGSGRANGVSYCSAHCREKVASRTPAARDRRSDENHRRKARKRGAFVARVYRSQVYERDGWRCQLCHRRVDPKLAFPHLMSATLDHIVPLAAGGTHEPRNVQLAHFICNSRKGAGVNGLGEQLRLVG